MENHGHTFCLGPSPETRYCPINIGGRIGPYVALQLHLRKRITHLSPIMASVISPPTKVFKTKQRYVIKHGKLVQSTVKVRGGTNCCVFDCNNDTL